MTAAIYIYMASLLGSPTCGRLEVARDEKEVLFCGCGYESSNTVTLRCPDTGRNRTGISMRKCGESGLLENASRRCLLLKAHSGNCTRKPTSMLFHFCPREGCTQVDLCRQTDGMALGEAKRLFGRMWRCNAQGS